MWRDRTKLWAVASEGDVSGLSAQMAVALGWRLGAGEAVELLRQVQARHPDDFWVNFTLGTQLRQQKQEGAIGLPRAAVGLRPSAIVAHNNLGSALADKGEVDEAIACYRKATALDPRYAEAHSNLGGALQAKGEVDQAIACYRKAIELDPRHGNAHY